MTELSHAAKAVADAGRSVYWQACDVPCVWNRSIAAAFRAAAEQCVPDDSEGHWVYIPHILAIANELETIDD